MRKEKGESAAHHPSHRNSPFSFRIRITLRKEKGEMRKEKVLRTILRIKTILYPFGLLSI